MGHAPMEEVMNEKGRRTLPHVFWDAFPGQKTAFGFLRQQGLTFSGTSYERALRELLDRYGVEKLGAVVTEQIKSRLHPDDLNELWRQFWAEEIPAMEVIQGADPHGYRSWVGVEFNSQSDRWKVKEWSSFAHFYFQYLGDPPPSGRKSLIASGGE